MDYEFRFFHHGLLEALHVTALPDDREALERARAYLETGPNFQYVEVRCGLRFLGRVEKDGRR